MNHTNGHTQGEMVPRGDLIRAMDDEDLAWVLMEFRFDAICKANGVEPALPDTQKKIVEWLRQMRSTECNCPLCQSKSTEKE